MIAENTVPEKAKYVPDVVWSEFKITPEALCKAKALESSVYLTRGCNLKCKYCKIIKTELDYELSVEKWMEAMDIQKELGVMFVNIAGGEPTTIKELPMIIKHLNDIGMAHSLVSNSLFGEEMLEGLTGAGLKAYVASVDVIDGIEPAYHDMLKSSAGLRMLEKMRERGVPYLCGNIVVSARNLNSVVSVAKRLSDEGIYVNLCPVIWGRGDKWEKAENSDASYKLTAEHVGKLKEISSELLRMKKAGALIIPTEKYIDELPGYGASLDWKCVEHGALNSPPRLTIDADGSMMTCINMRGEVSKRHNILKMREEGAFESFLSDWKIEASKCDGCYWSTMVTGMERLKQFESFKREVAANV